MPTFTCLVGPPGCGKSTLTARLGAQVITTDGLRAELTGIAAGLADRKVAVVFEVPLWLCLARNAGQERRVPQDVSSAAWPRRWRKRSRP